MSFPLSDQLLLEIFSDPIRTMSAIELSKIPNLDSLAHFVKSQVWVGDFDLMKQIVARKFELENAEGVRSFDVLSDEFRSEWVLRQAREDLRAAYQQ